MANFQYKTGSLASWLDAPVSAVHGTYAGTIEVTYPEPQARDGRGRPCAAVGSQSISLKSARMTASGMDFWMGKFSSSVSIDAEVWLTARDPRTNTWRKWTGWLMRPTWQRIQVGSGSISTTYENVEITVDLLTETT
jgi:hypothetical protein